MHLFCIVRAHADRLERWKGDIMARYYPYRCKDPATGKFFEKDKAKVQLVIRPIQLMELIFPEESLYEVVSAIQPYGGFSLDKGIIPKLKRIIMKILKLEPVPTGVFKGLDKQNQQLYKSFVDCYPIGLRKDKRDKDGVELL